MTEPKRHRRRWTEDDTAYIRNNPDMTGIDLAAILGRSKSTIYERRHQLGVTSSRLRNQPRLRIVQALVAKWAKVANCRVADVVGEGRSGPFVWARWQVWRELRARKYTYYGIAKVWGCDHSSVIHGVRNAGRPCPSPKQKRKAPEPVILTFNPPPARPKVVALPSSIAPVSIARLMGGRA